MTLDDETAARIVREAVEKNEVWSGRYVELVRAGYAARDAEVEELRATLATADRQFTRLKESSGKADAALVDARATLAKVREWAEQCFRNPRDGVDGRTDWEYLLSSILDESPTEQETPADEWEYQYIPVTADGEEWAGRSREECDALIREYADPNHWVHEPHNDDLYPVVSYRVERRRKAGPWMEVVPDDRA